MTQNLRTLEEQKEEFKQKKLLASPIAGLIAWSLVAISGIFFSGWNNCLGFIYCNRLYRLSSNGYFKIYRRRLSGQNKTKKYF